MARGNVIRREYPSEINKQKMQEIREANNSSFREVIKWANVDEELAQDKLFYKNYHIPELKAMFPDNPKAWCVDKYFPYAVGGPLYIDRPTQIEAKTEASILKIKENYFKELKHRYVCFKEGMTLLEAKEVLA